MLLDDRTITLYDNSFLASNPIPGQLRNDGVTLSQIVLSGRGPRPTSRWEFRYAGEHLNSRFIFPFPVPFSDCTFSTGRVSRSLALSSSRSRVRVPMDALLTAESSGD